MSLCVPIQDEMLFHEMHFTRISVVHPIVNDSRIFQTSRQTIYFFNEDGSLCIGAILPPFMKEPPGLVILDIRGTIFPVP